MKSKKKKIELLAPAGNMEKLETALLFGADAVYAGIPDYSLRVRINDFTKESLAEAVKLCHKKKKKLYATLNIFAHNRHLPMLPQYIDYLKKIGVDALIASDPGVIEVIKERWADAEIHLSTQANCTNWQAAKFWSNQGVKRVILGREVTLDEIKEIKKNLPKLELEYFVHGAMCMAYSGRCFLSKHFVDKSANLGDCVQPCRWRYHSKIADEVYISEEKRPGMQMELVNEEHGSYILNSKDLCLIKYLDELAASGVDSFKIEGRAKSIYYQAVVCGAYRMAIEFSSRVKNKELRSKKVDKLYKELSEKLVHRGYSTGFLLGGDGEQSESESHKKSAWEFCGTVLENKGKKIFVKVHNQIRAGDKIEVLTPEYDIIKTRAEKIYNEEKDEYVKSAHGGQNTIVSLDINGEAPTGSMVRRKVI